MEDRPDSSDRPRPAARGPLRDALLFVGALLFLFEEWLWTWTTRFFAWLGRLGLLRWLDAKLVRLPPALALVVLCLPILLLFPVKIAGLWMLAGGRIVSGCLLMLAAKVVSTAVIARIFLTCKPQLLRIGWFARLYVWVGELRRRVHHWIEQQPAWFEAKRFVRRLRTRVRAWSQGRWRPTAGDDAVRVGTLRRWRNWQKARRTRMATASKHEG